MNAWHNRRIGKKQSQSFRESHARFWNADEDLIGFAPDAVHQNSRSFAFGRAREVLFVFGKRQVPAPGRIRRGKALQLSGTVTDDLPT